MMLVRSSDSGDQAINHSGLNERACKVKCQYMHKWQLQNITFFHYFDKQNNAKLFVCTFILSAHMFAVFLTAMIIVRNTHCKHGWQWEGGTYQVSIPHALKKLKNRSQLILRVIHKGFVENSLGICLLR
jgi:hypothetical protein